MTNRGPCVNSFALMKGYILTPLLGTLGYSLIFNSLSVPFGANFDSFPTPSRVVRSLLQGVDEYMRHGFCLVSLASNMLERWDP